MNAFPNFFNLTILTFVWAIGLLPQACAQITEKGGTAIVTVDFSGEKGAFDRQLFSAMDAPFVDPEAYKLLKESNFALVANMDRDITPQKAKAISEYGFETLVFFDQRIPLAKAALERKAGEFLDKIDTIKKMYPGFDVQYIIFANEPDLPPPGHGFPEGLAFWNGTMDELFRDYEVFAKFVKSKRPDIKVGGLGFADAGSRVWIINFVDYVERNKVPLDFIPYHCYSIGLAPYREGVDFIKRILEDHTGVNPKLAVTELDIRALMVPHDQPYPEMDTAWKAAHNVLAMLFLADRGVWMAIDFGGPSRDAENNADFLWVKADGAKKPVYFAHQAFNALRGTIRLSQEGSNFETFGVAAGKSKDDDSLTVVIASYDQNSFVPLLTQPAPSLGEIQPSDHRIYKAYSLTATHLPWNSADTLVVERYLIDDVHAFTLEESREIRGAAELTLEREIALPQVQLLKVFRKK